MDIGADSVTSATGDRVGYVYETTCHANGKLYIGKRTGPFLRSYLGGGYLIRKAFKKYGRGAFSVRPIVFCGSQDELNAAEVEQIRKYREAGIELYNLSSGGEKSAVGVRKSAEARLRMSLAQKGHPVSAQTRANISKANKGRIITPEWRANLSKAGKGRIIPEDVRRRTSETSKKRYSLIPHHRIGSFQTDETKAKISKALKGRVFTEEWKANLRAAAKRNKENGQKR